MGIHHVLLMYSFVDGYLHCFLLLATVKNAAMNVGILVQVSESLFSFFFFVYTVPKSGNTGNLCF